METGKFATVLSSSFKQNFEKSIVARCLLIEQYLD